MLFKESAILSFVKLSNHRGKGEDGQQGHTMSKVLGLQMSSVYLWISQENLSAVCREEDSRKQKTDSHKQ